MNLRKFNMFLLVVSIIMIILCLNNFLFFLPDDFNDEINVSFLFLAPIIAILNSIVLILDLKGKIQGKIKNDNDTFMIVSGIVNYVPLLIGILAILQWGMMP